MLSHFKTLQATLEALLEKPKGILAADESVQSLGRKFEKIHLKNTTQNREAYRHMLFTTPYLSDFISGVILFSETFDQTIQGMPAPQYLINHDLIPGIKLDLGLVSFTSDHDDIQDVTKGLEDLDERCVDYFKKGARFAKWRCVYRLSPKLPSQELIEKNAESLALYAKIAQDNGLVPIIEPEVLMFGAHDIAACAVTTEQILTECFKKLEAHQVDIQLLILKPHMITPGIDSTQKLSAKEIAHYTNQVFEKVLPPELKGILFLSGGQTHQESVLHLNEIVKTKKFPWRMSFSYGRALQDDALMAWDGQPDNVQQAQNIFIQNAARCAQASIGQLKNEEF